MENVFIMAGPRKKRGELEYATWYLGNIPISLVSFSVMQQKLLVADFFEIIWYKTPPP